LQRHGAGLDDDADPFFRSDPASLAFAGQALSAPREVPNPTLGAADMVADRTIVENAARSAERITLVSTARLIGAHSAQMLHRAKPMVSTTAAMPLARRTRMTGSRPVTSMRSTGCCGAAGPRAGRPEGPRCAAALSLDDTSRLGVIRMPRRV